MTTLTENDFHIKLKQALKMSDYEIPPESFIDKIEQSLDENIKGKSYSEKELSKLINPRNCKHLITKHTYNKVLYFLQYVSKNYEEMTPSSEGLNDYIKKYSINIQLRPILIEIGELTFEGSKIKRSYKWSGKDITPDFVYSVCLLLLDKLKMFRDNTSKYGPEHDKVMTTDIKDGKDFDWLIRNRYDMFKEFPNGSVKNKFNRMVKSINNPKVGQVIEVSRTNGLIPDVSYRLNLHLIYNPYKTKWSLDQLIVLHFYFFNGLTNPEIAGKLDKTVNQIAQKKFALKKDGALEFSKIKTFLVRNNKRLNELFTENKKEGADIDQNLKLDLNNNTTTTIDTPVNTPVEIVDKKEPENKDDDLNKTLNVLYLEIASNKQQLKKEKKKNKKMKNEFKEMKNKIEFLDEMLTRFLITKSTS